MQYVTEAEPSYSMDQALLVLFAFRPRLGKGIFSLKYCYRCNQTLGYARTFCYTVQPLSLLGCRPFPGLTRLYACRDVVLDTPIMFPILFVGFPPFLLSFFAWFPTYFTSTLTRWPFTLRAGIRPLFYTVWAATIVHVLGRPLRGIIPYEYLFRVGCSEFAPDRSVQW